MNGRRCKALKREFQKRFGRAPNEAEFGRKSEWRRLKKDYLKMRRGL